MLIFLRSTQFHKEGHNPEMKKKLTIPNWRVLSKKKRTKLATILGRRVGFDNS